MAEEKNEAIKTQLEEGKERREASFKEYTERMKGKPTPTQEENDRAMLGEHIVEHEPDGSPLESDLHELQTRQMERRPGQQQGGYTTRQGTPQPAHRTTSTREETNK
jgi:dephospho-CoA kinase